MTEYWVPIVFNEVSMTGSCLCHELHGIVSNYRTTVDKFIYQNDEWQLNAAHMTLRNYVNDEWWNP